MMNVISNSIYAIRVRTPIIFIFCYLIFYLINLIRLKKSFKDIEKYEKRLEILKKKKKLLVLLKIILLIQYQFLIILQKKI